MTEETKKNRPEWDREHDLYIGVKNDLSPFTVDLNALTRGLVVVGQSGCGKSFMLGRLVEEIVRKTRDSRILIIDPNSDFCEGVELKEKDDFEKILKKYESGQLKDEHVDFEKQELKKFNNPFGSRRKWPKSSIFGLKDGQTKFNLSWKALSNTSKTAYILANNEDAYLENALEIISGYMRVAIKKRVINKDILAYLDSLNGIYLLSRVSYYWYCLTEEEREERLNEDLKYRIKEKSKVICKWKEISDWLGLSNKEQMLNINNKTRFVSKERIWREYEKGRKYEGLPEKLFKGTNINIIDLGDLKINTSRIVCTFYAIDELLKLHKKNTEEYHRLPYEKKNEIENHYEISKKKHKDDPRLRTFILIDEAHNFAPEGTSDPHEKMLGELIHTIAAEGRKYGLHLILATQRPNKVKRGLLGELDNAIIMKMNSRSDLEELAKEMRILDVKLLEPCLSFQGQGNAIAVGEMTRMAPYTQIFKSAPRRTKEGGVDIPFF